MNKFPIIVSWLATIILLYIAHMKFMMAFPTPMVLIGSTIVATYCYYKVALHFGGKLLDCIYGYEEGRE
jgi:hypothetical protein